MQAASRNVTITQAQATITLPSDLVSGLTGPYFIDGLPIPAGVNYPSAALIGNTTSQGPRLCMVAWSQDSNWVQEAPASLGSFTAACGIAGGLVALATVDNGMPSVELRKSALVDSDWGSAGSISFNVTGTIQAMAQRDDLLYGFIKGSGGGKNAFFTVAPQAGATPVAVYYDSPEAAAAFFPLPPKTNYIGIPRPIAFYGQHRMYAIGESHSNVLCASLDYGTTTSFPIPKADTWSLFIDEPIGKVYGLYKSDHGYVLPYTIQGDGSFQRESGIDTLRGGGGNCPALDSNLRLLYMVSPFYGLQVVDVDTDKVIPLGKNNPLPPGLDPGGTWADSDHSLLLVIGVGNSRSQMGIYHVSVSG